MSQPGYFVQFRNLAGEWQDIADQPIFHNQDESIELAKDLSKALDGRAVQVVTTDGRKVFCCERQAA